MTRKRLFDLALATASLLVLAPVMAAIALWVKFDSPGPILYRGPRVGLHGRPFHMFKFRSMRVDADKIGPSSTSADDPRITRSGRWLRALKLDELPQLFNIVRGEMSFVGPRPQVKWAVDLYSDEERKLLDVRPGITDYASIVFSNEGEILKGSSDPDRDYLEKIAPEKNRLGLEYVRRSSLWVDLTLILATAGLVVGLDPRWALPHRPREPQFQ